MPPSRLPKSCLLPLRFLEIPSFFPRVLFYFVTRSLKPSIFPSSSLYFVRSFISIFIRFFFFFFCFFFIFFATLCHTILSNQFGFVCNCSKGRTSPTLVFISLLITLKAKSEDRIKETERARSKRE